MVCVIYVWRSYSGRCINMTQRTDHTGLDDRSYVSLVIVYRKFNIMGLWVVGGDVIRT